MKTGKEFLWFLPFIAAIAFWAIVWLPEDIEREKAWSVLQRYLAAAKENNIEQVTALSYQLSNSCKNYAASDTNKTDCDAKMQNVFIIGSQFRKKDYTDISFDDTQIILSTREAVIIENGIGSAFHGAILFIKEDGGIKLLSFNPIRGSILPLGSSTPRDLQDQLKARTHDTDKDGLADMEETATDPHNRDSDGDGYWDGIEVLFY